MSTKESGVVGLDSLDDLRGDGLAGTAPGGEEVDDHQGAGLSASGIEVGLAVEFVSRGSCLYSLTISPKLRLRGRAHKAAASPTARPASNSKLESDKERLLTPGGCEHRKKPLKR